jgi:hypothetical protein
VGNIVCRFIDISNYLRVQIDGSTVYLVSVNNGSTSTLASVSAALTNGVTYNLRVVINGTAVSVFVDGTQKLTFTLSGSDASVFSQAVATKFGFRTGGGGDVSTMRFDNFTVEV